MTRSMIRFAPRAACVGMIAWLALGGCATAPAPAPGTVSSPMPGREPEPVGTQAGAEATPTPPVSPMPGASGAGTPVGTTASGGTISRTATSAAPPDSTPSAEARAVLSTIPEAIPGNVLTAEPGPQGTDSLEAPVEADTTDGDGADLPIPALTQPLGDRPGARTPVDTTSAPAASAPAAPSSPLPSAGAPPTTSPDSCWRVQVAAVPEPARAAALRDAAHSQLWVTWVIEIEKGLHKVRSNCLTSDGAERLKQRALAAGFQGAFKFRKTK